VEFGVECGEERGFEARRRPRDDPSVQIVAKWSDAGVRRTG
jgi:hypothetical protein